MERILLQEDKGLLAEISGDLTQFMPLLEKVKVNYEALELEDFTNDLFKEITLEGVGRIENDFTENLEKQIDKLEVTNSILRENLSNGCKPIFQKFANSVIKLRRFKPDTYSRLVPLKLKFISYKNNEFFLSEKDKEDILENDCRIYLEDERELKLYKNLENFIGAYKNVKENLKELNFKNDFREGEEIAAIRNIFLTHNGGELTIKAGAIKYASKYNENRLKYS